MRIGVNFGVTLYEYGPADQAAIARRAEELGYDSLWAGDHLILPKVIPGRDPKNLDADPSKVAPAAVRKSFRDDAPMPDMLVLFAYLAGVTTRLRFGSGIHIPALRPPMVTAKAVATLDVVSGGRFDLGIGLGWAKEEFDLAGEDFHTRGRRTDEIVAILRKLWTEEHPSHEGRYYSFGPVSFEPRPVQRPVPILVGGESEPALRRAAKLGDGWCARYHTPESLRDHLARIGKMRREYGRDHLPFETIVWINRDEDLAAAKSYTEAGADRLIVTMRDLTDRDELFGYMERFAAETLGKV